MSWGRARALAALFGAYLLLAVLATWPLARDAADHVFGEGTPPLNVWAMGWVLHQLVSDPVHLFDGNVFYPYAHTLAFSEHLFVPALIGAPVVALTGNLVLAHNVVALLSLATAGLGMYLLARELTGDAAASFAAGLLYAFHTWNVNELIRIQILSNQWFPFLLLALLRFFERPTGGRAAWAGVLYALQSLSCMYWAFYLPLLVAPTVVVLEGRHRLPWRSLRSLATSLGAALLLTAAFTVPYVQNARDLGLQRGEPRPVPLDRYFDVLPGNLLYAGLLGSASPNENAAHFLGFLAMALGLLGAIGGIWAPGRTPLRPLLVGLAAAGFVLSLGVEIRWGDTLLAPGPYALLMRHVPGFRNIRYPERFSILLILPFCPMVAAGLARLRGLVRPAGVALLSAGILLEHLSLPLPLSTLPAGAAIPEVYRWLAVEAGVHVVAEVPASRAKMERVDALPMYLSTAHWKRTVQGFTGYFPPTYNFIKWRLYHFPSPDSLAFLMRFGVETVVVSPEPQLPEWAREDLRWELKGPFREGHAVLRLKGVDGQRYAPPPDDAAGFAEIDRSGWQVQGSKPGAERASDGDLTSAWSTEVEQVQGDFYRIRLTRPARVARVVMSLRSPFYFPMHLKLVGQTGDDEWSEMAFDETAVYDRLFATLLHRPKDAALVVDVEPREVRAVRLRIPEKDPFWMPWIMSEVRLYERR